MTRSLLPLSSSLDTFPKVVRQSLAFLDLSTIGKLPLVHGEKLLGASDSLGYALGTDGAGSLARVTFRI